MIFMGSMVLVVNKQGLCTYAVGNQVSQCDRPMEPCLELLNVPRNDIGAQVGARKFNDTNIR